MEFAGSRDLLECLCWPARDYATVLTTAQDWDRGRRQVPGGAAVSGRNMLVGQVYCCHSGAMALETINGTLQLTRLSNESAEYVARREELRLAEIELMRQRERVAAMRRRLPPGAVVQDYVFQEGPPLDADDAPIRAVRLSDLFSGPDRSVVIYHLMYGK